MDKEPLLNVFDKPLLPHYDNLVNESPITAYYRDGCCDSAVSADDSHTVCVEVTQKFLGYSRLRGCDLTTPVPEVGFPGLKVDERSGLCATRWLKAYESNMAPPVFLQRTNKKVLEIVPLKILKEYAIDVI